MLPPNATGSRHHPRPPFHTTTNSLYQSSHPVVICHLGRRSPSAYPSLSNTISYVNGRIGPHDADHRVEFGFPLMFRAPSDVAGSLQADDVTPTTIHRNGTPAADSALEWNLCGDAVSDARWIMGINQDPEVQAANQKFTVSLGR